MNQQMFTMSNSCWRILRAIFFLAWVVSSTCFAQNPVPQIVGPVNPMTVAPGSGAFILSVYGANFVQGAVVTWNYEPRATTFISAHELHAQILAADIEQSTAGFISVTNPAPGGGNSSASWAQVEVHAPISAINLINPKYYPLGTYLLMAANFVHDEKLDLVGQSEGAVVFYPGTGDGTFNFQGIVAGFVRAGGGGAFGDFNNDGNLDFAYGRVPANKGTLGYEVMLGDGTGKFDLGWAANNTSYPNFSGGVWAGDFNQDGNLDLILGDHAGFSLFLGNGDGTFRHSVDVSTLEAPQDLQIGDFNGDGKLDVMALVNPGGGNTAYIYFFAGNGDGTFQPAQTVFSSVALRPSGLEVSDFNGDGKLDLSVQTATQIGILIGNGDGTFQPPTYVSAVANSDILFVYAVGDFYSDGTPGLLISQYHDAYIRYFTFFQGNGDGTFQQGQTIRETYTGLPILLGDFNSDGLLDFITPTGLGLEIYLQE